MRGILVLTVLLGLGPAASSATQAIPRAGSPDSTPPREVVLLRGPVVVPLQLAGGLPVVEARINGRGPYRLGIETGARFSVVRQRVAEALALQRTGAGDGLRADSIQVGEATFRDVRVSVLPIADEQVDGVLGLPAFAEVLLIIDYPGRVARLERGNLPAVNGQDVLALSRVGTFWGVDLDLGGVTAVAVLDTRSTGGFSATPVSARSLSFAGSPAVVGMARGAAIQPLQITAARLSGDARLGRYVFQRPIVSIRPLPEDFPQNTVIGGSVLQNFAVTLDQANRRVRFSRSDAAPIPAPPPMRGLGFMIRPSPGGARLVGLVRPGSPAEQQGLRVGDEIIELGGVPPAAIGPATVSGITSSRVSEVKVTVRRDGQELTFQIPLVTLVP